MKQIFLILLSLTFSQYSLSNDDKEVNHFALSMLATGKMTGGCGIFKLQIDFQENTGLTGGDDFMARFWTTEAARLGMTLEEYATSCHKMVASYKSYESMFQQAEVQ